MKTFPRSFTLFPSSVEDVAHHVFSNITGERLPTFPVMRFDDAMARFGVDKPDLRYAMEIADITAEAGVVSQPLFGAGTGASPSVLRHVLAFKADKASEALSRKRIDALQTHARGIGITVR